jgi:hypothetical protein
VLRNHFFGVKILKFFNADLGHFFGVKKLKFFDADPGSGIKKIQIRNLIEMRNQCFGSVFILIRIRIQRLRLETNTDPGDNI